MNISLIRVWCGLNSIDKAPICRFFHRYWHLLFSWKNQIIWLQLFFAYIFYSSNLLEPTSLVRFFIKHSFHLYRIFEKCQWQNLDKMNPFIEKLIKKLINNALKIIKNQKILCLYLSLILYIRWYVWFHVYDPKSLYLSYIRYNLYWLFTDFANLFNYWILLQLLTFFKTFCFIIISLFSLFGTYLSIDDKIIIWTFLK